MNRVRKVYESDSSVHVDVDVGAPHCKVQVVVTREETGAEANGWPP